MTTPPDERRFVDALPLVCDSLHEAYRLGRIYGRHETLVAAARTGADVDAIQAELLSVYGVHDDETLVADWVKLKAVTGDTT